MAAYQRKQDLQRVERCKTDLQDDSGNISDINSKITEIQEDFRDSLRSDCTNRIVSCLEDFREPFKRSDSYLTAADNALEREIEALKREIEAEEEAERVARESKSFLGIF